MSTMIRFNFMFVIFLCLYLIIVPESQSKSVASYRNRGCPPIQLNNGRVKLRSGGRVVRITCNRLFKLVQGSEIMTCIRGEWDTEAPICAKTGCSTHGYVQHGKLIMFDEAKLEIECDVGYVIDGPSFTYCNEYNEWNDKLKGCKENDRIYSSCDFESSDGRLCGWQNDKFNDVDWLADKMSFAFYGNRRHVPPGSSQYFTSNYVSLDAGNHGSSTAGRLVSPQIPPIESKQRCLIFSYKVISGSSYGAHTLTVTFGGIPHWTTSEGEGRVIIGLYKFNITSQIIIEGKSCKAAIDNMVITEGYSCTQKPYEDEVDTCHDNCGKISNLFDDNSCSCDWECHSNDNCCSDISRKCPYIKPLEEINRLYLTTVTPVPVKVTTTVKKHISNNTILLKMDDESNISNVSVIATTPINEYNVTVNKIKNNATLLIPISPDIITTENPLNISTLNNTFIFNSTLFLHNTSNTKTTVMTNSDIRTDITITEKIIISPNATTNILMDNTTSLATKSINNISSTMKPLVINTTYASTIFNISNITTKSDNQLYTTKLVNIFNSTIIPSIINKTFSTETNGTTIATTSILMETLTSTTKRITDTPNNIITTTEKSISASTVTTTIPESTKSINILNSIIKPLKTTTYTSRINNVPNITTKYLTEYSTNPTKQINSSSTVIRLLAKSNLENSFGQLSTTFITKSSNIQNITQNDVITKSKNTISNSTTRIPNTNFSTVSNTKPIVFDIQPNVNLSHLSYETNKQLYNYDDKLPLSNNNIRNEATASTIMYKQNINPDNTSTEHMNKSESSQFFSSYAVTVVKYLAALGVILITLKYSLSSIKWYFKKPNDDDMDSSFIKTDSEGTCNMELKSKRI